MKGISMAACALCAAMLVSGTQVFARGTVQVKKDQTGENTGIIKKVAATTDNSLLRPVSTDNTEQKALTAVSNGALIQIPYHHTEETVLSHNNHVMPIQQPGMLKSTDDNTEKTYISREKAKQIAQRSAPSGALLSGSIIDYTTEADPHWDPEAHHDVDSLREEDKGYKMKWDD